MEPRTIYLSLTRKIRPIRFAFLVEPGSRRQLLSVIRVNTILWGGMFNAIVPLYRRTPSSWQDKPFGTPAAKDILSGYLDAFDPDVVVNATNRSIEIPGFVPKSYAEKPIVPLSEVFDLGQVDDPIGFGTSVLDLYEHLYRTEFRFEHERPTRCVLPKTGDAQMRAFVATVFGQFPDRPPLFRSWYRQAVRADEVSVRPTQFFKLLRGRGFPLRVGSTFLEPDLLSYTRTEPTLFYLDATDNLDLIDFWNLRAAGWRVFPVPCQWADELKDECSAFAHRSYQPHRHNAQLMLHAMLITARSIEESEAIAYVQLLRLPKPDMLPAQRWYPRLWDGWGRHADSIVPVPVHSDEEQIDDRSTDGEFAFRLKKPSFVGAERPTDHARWANVIALRRYGGTPELASVIPRDLPDVGRLLDTVAGDTRSAREGLVFAGHFEGTRHCRCPSSLSVFERWAKQHKCKLALSAGGLIAQQLLRQIGGVHGAWMFADIEVLKLFERLSQGRPIGAAEVISRLKQQDLRSGNNRRSLLNALVRARALEIGPEIQCSICQQRTWFKLNGLNATLTCERCLNEFEFPAAAPPTNPWAYKSAGAFSVNGYAGGAFTVALALRFFSQVLDAETTAIPSFTLQRGAPAPLNVEADFGMLYRKEIWRDTEPYWLFGECTTFAPFERKDVRRMRAVGQAFPGAVLVFCTMNPTLTPTERRLIRPLAIFGRRHLAGERWRNPVLILTRTELTADLSVAHTWERAGGRLSHMADRARFFNLTELCDATQQLYLDIEPRARTLERHYERRRARALKRAHDS